MKRPNALPPDQMTVTERRAELCALLALGLVRLRLRNHGKTPADTREFPLHNPANQSGSVGPTDRRPA
jgi:hypothetical protein